MLCNAAPSQALSGMATRLFGPRLMAVWLAAVATVALVSCGGGSGGVGGPAAAVPEPSPVQLQASKPGALLSYVQQKLLAQIDQGLTGNGDGGVMLSSAPLSGAAATAPAGSLTSVGFASTTLQEGGVDESDLLKTDGNRVFAMTVAGAGDQRLARLSVHLRQANGSLQAAGSLDLPKDDRFEGLHLAANGEQLALVGQNQQFVILGGGNPLAVTSGTAASLSIAPASVVPIQTVVNLVSTTPGQPLATTTSLRIDGQLIDTRTIDNTLYVVTTWFPRFDGVFSTTGASVAQRKEAVARVTSQQVLPTVTITGATGQPVTQTLMADTDCQLQAANASVAVQLTTITAIDLASPTVQRSSRCLLGGVNAIYMSAKNLYLATSRYSVVAEGNTLFYPGQPVTDIHKFAVNALLIAYRGSGEVSGHLGWDASKTSYRLSEHQNDLRVVTYVNSLGWQGDIGAPVKSAPVSPALVTVLREDTSSGQLRTIATLPNARRPAPIGLSGEQV
jgi:Beta propeller domain